MKINRKPASRGQRRRASARLAFCLAFVLVTGCPEPGPPGSSQPDPLADAMARRWEAERELRDRDAQRHRVEIRSREEDMEAVTSIWISTAAAVFVLVMLLARERHGRRTLERLLNVILGRDQSRGDPPGSG
jgi:hypothetical protein